MKKFQKVSKVIGIILAVLSFFVVIVERSNAFNNFFLHTDLLQSVSDNMMLSYTDAQRIYHPDDKVWPYLIGLIYKYSNSKLPRDKQPQTVARWVAVSSSETMIGTSSIAEWTAPSTPLVVLYKPWPGNEVKMDDLVIVGTIGDLNSWITQNKDDFDFRINQLILGGLSLIVTCILFFFE